MKTHHKIILGDCLEGLGLVNGGEVDLAFTDPPYNVGKDYGKMSNDNRGDYPEWCKEWITESFRVLKPSGTAYILTLPRHLSWMLPIMDELGVFHSLIIWKNASGGFHMERRYFPKWTAIPVFGKTDEYIFNRHVVRQEPKPEMLRWGSYRTKAQGQMSDIWDDVPFVYAGSIAHKEAILEPGTNRKKHPTQMPEELVRRAILFSTNEGDTILDPFAGSFTTTKVARDLGRNSISMEINPDYWFNIGETRLKANIPTLDNSVTFEVIKIVNDQPQHHPQKNPQNTPRRLNEKHKTGVYSR